MTSTTQNGTDNETKLSQQSSHFFVMRKKTFQQLEEHRQLDQQKRQQYRQELVVVATSLFLTAFSLHLHGRDYIALSAVNKSMHSMLHDICKLQGISLGNRIFSSTHNSIISTLLTTFNYEYSTIDLLLQQTGAVIAGGMMASNFQSRYGEIAWIPSDVDYYVNQQVCVFIILLNISTSQSKIFFPMRFSEHAFPQTNGRKSNVCRDNG